MWRPFGLGLRVTGRRKKRVDDHDRFLSVYVRAAVYMRRPFFRELVMLDACDCTTSDKSLTDHRQIIYRSLTDRR